VRQNVPGALQHASGEVDEFDAALVRGARPSDAPGGETPPSDSGANGGEGQPPGGGGAKAPPPDMVVDTPADPDHVVDDDQSGAPDEPAGDRTPAPRAGPAVDRPRGNRGLAFIRASWAELQRVQWPDRRQVSQATAVVLGFVVVAGAYLGIADFVAKKVVDAIL